MLAELAAANAAFAVIKKFISNGRELADCTKAISDFVTAKDALQKKGNKKKNSWFGKLGGNTADDLEEFMALEKIRQQEEELKQFMIYAGRAGLWHDWIRFQGEARRRRQQEKIDAVRKRQELIEVLGYATVAVTIIVVCVSILYAAYIWRN
jgi:hypothetical protein